MVRIALTMFSTRVRVFKTRAARLLRHMGIENCFILYPVRDALRRAKSYYNSLHRMNTNRGHNPSHRQNLHQWHFQRTERPQWT